MQQIHDRVAGLDVHRDSVVACFRQLGPRGGVVREKERFTTTTAGLEVLEAWLADREVQLVAMEATGVYWKPVLYALERRFTVWVCNARNVKKVPGRKSDLSDAEWLADVAAHGMVRPSFVPPLPIRELRELTRYRKTQIDARVAEIQRLEKVLQDAGVKLTSVASKVLTQSGRSMIEALIAGERDSAKLAALAKGKMRPKIPALTEALAGHFGSHHAVACRRILAHLDFLDETIGALTEQIAARTAAFDAVYIAAPGPGLRSPHDRCDHRRDRRGHDRRAPSPTEAHECANPMAHGAGSPLLQSFSDEHVCVIERSPRLRGAQGPIEPGCSGFSCLGERPVGLAAPLHLPDQLVKAASTPSRMSTCCSTASAR